MAAPVCRTVFASVAIVAACSSVPEVVFVPDVETIGFDGGQQVFDGGSGTSDTGLITASDGAAIEECPKVPRAICCGAIACIGCDRNKRPTDCAECTQTCAPGTLCCRSTGTPRCVGLNDPCR